MTRLRLPVAVLFAALTGLGPVSAVQSRSDAAAIDRAKRVSARALDPALPAQPFEEWFRRVVGSPGAIEWARNDCGEPTGDPSIDRTRDFPICVEAVGTLGPVPGVDKSAVVARLVVGTERTGVSG